MQEIIAEWGYIGIFLLILIENVFPPIPSEIILPLGGFMTAETKMVVPGVIIAATIGSVLGAFILYGVGRLVNKDVIEKWLDGKVGKILRFKKEDVEKATAWFEKRGNITVLFCRCIPVVRSLISIPAGISKMKVLPFTIYTLVGTVVWNTILIVAGSMLGNNWRVVADIVDKFKYVVLAVIAVAGIAFLVWYFTRKVDKEPEEKESNKEKKQNK